MPQLATCSYPLVDIRLLFGILTHFELLSFRAEKMPTSNESEARGRRERAEGPEIVASAFIHIYLKGL